MLKMDNEPGPWWRLIIGVGQDSQGVAAWRTENSRLETRDSRIGLAAQGREYVPCKRYGATGGEVEATKGTAEERAVLIGETASLTAQGTYYSRGRLWIGLTQPTLLPLQQACRCLGTGTQESLCLEVVLGCF